MNNTNYKIAKENILKQPKIWCITGVSGFIGSNLLEALLNLDQKVIGLDNFSTGHKKNLDEVRQNVGENQWKNFNFVEGDISNYNDCITVCKNVNFVLHQAAIGSVPRSIEDPIMTNQSNINGFVNIINAAKEEGVDSFVYAASSSTYGDSETLPKTEDVIGKPLSPYAVTKYVNELYAEVFSRCYGIKTIGLRYFNVFGKRQDPDGAYAAVIPKWIQSMIKTEDVFVNGDGSTSRDFSHVENIIQANILAATSKIENKSEVFNIGYGGRTTLNELFTFIRDSLDQNNLNYPKDAIYKEFRDGDVLHSQASIEKAKKLLNYEPVINVNDGLIKTMQWYIKNLKD